MEEREIEIIGKMEETRGTENEAPLQLREEAVSVLCQVLQCCQGQTRSPLKPNKLKQCKDMGSLRLEGGKE